MRFRVLQVCDRKERERDGGREREREGQGGREIERWEKKERER